MALRHWYVILFQDGSTSDIGVFSEYYFRAQLFILFQVLFMKTVTNLKDHICHNTEYILSTLYLIISFTGFSLE